MNNEDAGGRGRGRRGGEWEAVWHSTTSDGGVASTEGDTVEEARHGSLERGRS